MDLEELTHGVLCTSAIGRPLRILADTGCGRDPVMALNL